MADARNSFSGMDQDRSKSKQSGTTYHLGRNIKVVTEEGSSTGNIENEDGNLLSFNLPSIESSWVIRFDDPENPVPGSLIITFADPGTSNFNPHPTEIVDSVENLYEQIVTIMSVLPDEDYKVVREGKLIRVFRTSTNISDITGTGGLSENINSFEVEKQENLEIIGWTTLRDEIVVFSTNETSETPDSNGQIWKFNIDPVTKEIDDILPNGNLSVHHHLMYNNRLNFSKHWHIGTEAVGHYENSKTGRVYWTDEYNELRSANLLDPEFIGSSPGNLSIASQVSMNIPTVQNVTETGLLPAGASVQYAYRLFNASIADGGNGGVSAYSPISNPIPLGSFDPSNQGLNYDEHGGLQPAQLHNKAVTYTLENIDTRFDYIEHISILLISGQTGPIINKFYEEEVPSDGNLTVTHNEHTGEAIELEDFTFINRSFKRCKTLTVKDKRLVVANLDTLDVSVEGFDSRAYRFGADKKARLQDDELGEFELTANGATPLWDDVPEKHDVINPYNKDEDDGHRFQSDGSTMGGSGKNISYKFTFKDMDIKNQIGGSVVTDGTGVAKTGRHSPERVDHNGSIQTLNGVDRAPASDHTNFRGPMMTGAFTGYARGEVYRFGIVFYDKSSNPYNVKWIGDIRIPESYDVDGNGDTYVVSYCPFGGGANVTYTYDNPIRSRNIGIEFDVDLSSVKSVISGYEIVRVKREAKDRTKWGTGLFAQFDRGDYGGIGSRRNTAQIFGFQSTPGGNIFGTSQADVEDRADIRVNGNVEQCFYMPDRPNVGNYGQGTLETGAFISPTSILGSVVGYVFKSGDKLKTIGSFEHLDETGSVHQFVNTLSNGNKREITGALTMGHDFIHAKENLTRETRTITAQALVNPGAIVPTSLHGGTNQFLNCSASSSRDKFLAGDYDHNPAGLGDVKQVVRIDSPWTYYGNESTLPTGSDQRWRVCSYERDLINQYGGDTFEARSKSSYISNGAFEQIFEYSVDNRSLEVYGGDTWIHQFGYLYYFMNWKGVDPHFASGDTKQHLGMNFPVECGMNLAYMDNYRKYGNKEYRDWYTTGDPTGTGANPGPASLQDEATYSIAGHYNQVNDVKKIFYPADYIKNTVEEHPHRIWASDHKQDGELTDSWRTFLVNNYTEVEGQYGEVNKITTLNDKFFYYQDRAFGVASVNDRAVINDENGVALTLGSGGILDDFGYISRITGTKQKFSVIPTERELHHFDTSLKKWFIYNGGNNFPLSDIKGLHSFFAKYNATILKDDRILEDVGVHGVFDPVRNKVIMTFLEAYLAEAGEDYNDYTVTYNNNTQSFESFSDDKPNIWLRSSGDILSVNPKNNGQGYLAYAGEKNNFYGDVYDSEIQIVINPSADIACIMDNIAYKGEMYINDIDQASLTFDSIRVFNDHQDSGTIQLVVDQNVRRKIRTWRMNVPRDAKPNDPRIRDYYMMLVLKHTPNNNERLVLHDIVTAFRPAPH